MGLETEIFLGELGKKGKRVLKHDMIQLGGDRIHSYENGFSVTFDNDIVLTPETRLYLLHIDEGVIVSDLKANILECTIFEPSIKRHRTVELVKLVGSGYAVYNIYYVEKLQHLRFSLDTKISELELRMTNCYYVNRAHTA